MKEPDIPSNESERIELVHQLDILDTVPEEAYDAITYIASVICHMPMSTVTIIDRDRQWFKSIVGGEGKENPRIYSFCAHAILGSDILEVPDSQKDERFKDNPLVIGEPYVRFYAGAPLELKNGLRVGTLCVIDHKPNKLDEEQLKALHFLSLQVTKVLDLRLKIKEIEFLKENDANMVNMLTHELRNPLTSIKGYFSMTTSCKEKYHDPDYDILIEKCSKNTERMLGIVNEFLNYSHWKDGFWTLQKKENDINVCICESAVLVRGYLETCKVSIELRLDENLPKIDFDYGGILSVLENLISNAAKYSPEGGKVILSSEIADNAIKVKIQDFGPGIPEKDCDKVFEPFGLYQHQNRAGIKSTGLGLSIVKKIIDKHGGKLNFESVENQGTTFYFTLPLPIPTLSS